MIWLLAVVLFGFMVYHLLAADTCSRLADQCRGDARTAAASNAPTTAAALRELAFESDRDCHSHTRWAIMHSVASVVAVLAGIFG